MRMKACVVLALVVGAACSPGGKGGGGAAADSARRDSLTRRERDSIIARSRLPGAKAVGKAITAEDAAAAHNAAIDSANAEMAR